MNLSQIAKFFRWIVLGFLVLCLTHFNLRLYAPIPAVTRYAQVKPQLINVRSALDKGLAQEMQQLFPEGYFFSYLLYGLSWINVGLQEEGGSKVRTQALQEARWVYQKLSEPDGYAPFPADLDPRYGIFYQGWRNYLLTGILRLQTQPDPTELERYQDQCTQIAAAIKRSSSPFLASYTESVWPVDMFPALVSLRGYQEWIDGRYKPLIANWIQAVQAHSESIPHRTQPFQEEARATSQTLMLLLIPELDRSWAIAAYGQFRQDFVTQLFGLPSIREYPKGTSGKGDVDSGPLVAGISLSASVVAMGTARLNGDQALQQALWQGSELVGLPTPWFGQRRYWFGLLPIADEFVVWAQTATPWFATELEPQSYSVPFWWRWPSHGFSLVIGFLFWKCLRPKSKRKRRRQVLHFSPRER